MNAERLIKDTLRKLTGRPTRADERARYVEFLHIGKTSGRQIKNIASQVNRHTDHVRIRCHGHSRTLANLREGNRYFFSIREPVARFRSAFYWCKMQELKSAPRDWSPDETVAFSHFPEANDLAEALSDAGKCGDQARAAMMSINHCNSAQVDWLRNQGSFLELRPPVWIIRQEQFQSDLNEFLRRIKYDGPVSFSDKRDVAHQIDYSDIPQISERGAANLRDWYVQDVHFYRTCCDWLDAGGVSQG